MAAPDRSQGYPPAWGDPITLHFDLPTHFLPFQDFVEFGSHVEGIVKGLNQSLFQGNLNFEIVVLPPKEGGFIEVLGAITAVPGLVYWYSRTEGGIAFFEGLTGKPPVYWQRKAGEKLREMLQSGTGVEAAPDEATGNTEPEAFEDADPTEVRVVESTLISRSVTSILAKDNDELSKAGVSVREFRSVYAARNAFFTRCNKNPNIEGLGFDDTNEFPLRRSDFSSRLVRLPPEPTDEEEEDWTVATVDLIAVGPVWERELQETRKWLAHLRDGAGNVHFAIEDEEFWERCDAGQLHLRPRDLLRVQMAYHAVGTRWKDCRVLRVLRYNEDELAAPLPEDALRALLGQYQDARSQPTHADLFAPPEDASDQTDNE